MKGLPGLHGGLAQLQVGHGESRGRLRLHVLGGKDRRGLDGIGQVHGGKVVGQGEQQTAQGQEGCAHQRDAQAQETTYFHGVSSRIRR